MGVQDRTLCHEQLYDAACVERRGGRGAGRVVCGHSAKAETEGGGDGRSREEKEGGYRADEAEGRGRGEGEVGEA